MVSAKDIIIKVIPAGVANSFIRKTHYSHKVVNNSQLHFGAFLGDRMHGAMSFGPSLDKRKIQGLVSETGWNEFIELNRMAFDDSLPKNSESRCISIAIKLIKKNAPHIRWVISFSDACQCGDGCIYRASGFYLTGITRNAGIWEMPDGFRVHVSTFAAGDNGGGIVKRKYGYQEGTSIGTFLRMAGAKKIKGFQLRYIYFINKDDLHNLTVPVIPFSKIDEIGAGMYKGQKISRELIQESTSSPNSPNSLEQQSAWEVLTAEQPADLPGGGGANPTSMHQ
jgi:hypothetical protein